MPWIKQIDQCGVSNVINYCWFICLKTGEKLREIISILTLKPAVFHVYFDYDLWLLELHVLFCPVADKLQYEQP